MILKKVLPTIIILFGLSAWCYSCLSIKINYTRLALSKHLNADIKSLIGINSKMQPNDILYISGNLGDNQFMVSRWVAYVLKSVNLVYAPEHHAGGYLHGLDFAYEKNLSHITHVLEKNSGNLEFDGESIFRNKTFHVRPFTPPEIIGYSGFYSPEHWGRWMGDKGEITVLGKNAGELEMQVTSIYPTVPKNSQILMIQSQNGDFTFSISDNNKVIRVPLNPELSIQKVTISPQFNAISPFDSGASEDRRRLSVGFSKIEILKQ